MFVKGINRAPCKPLIKVHNLLSTVCTVLPLPVHKEALVIFIFFIFLIRDSYSS